MKIKFALAKLKYFWAVLIVMLCAGAVFSQGEAPFSLDTSPLPPSTGFVNDFAGIIDAGVKLRLETRLKEFKEKTGVEIAVAVVRTTGERPIFEYSLAVARGWKIGSKEDDNPSALLFVAIDDRKYFTQVSKDLQDELPDGIAGNLQRKYLVPEFRQGNYAKGIADTIEAYIRTIESKMSGTAPPPAGSTDKPGKSGGLSRGLYNLFCCLVVLGVLALIMWGRRGGKSDDDDDRWGNGGFGGGAASALPWIIGSILTSGSGRSSSGDWGGSSDGGGGWGGFGGGGDFDGGGAGGDW